MEYARLVGAEDIELHARLTLGGLMVDSGDVEGGLAEMAAVCDRVVELGYVSVLGRCHVNYASSLESVGRSRQAVEVTAEGVEIHRRFGLADSRPGSTPTRPSRCSAWAAGPRPGKPR